MEKKIDVDALKILFNKPYGAEPPTKQKWAEFYNDDVTFVDPTQNKFGLDNYIDAQDKLIKRCDDVFLKTHAILLSDEFGFIEWTMGLKIIGKEFIYPGTTRLIFDKNGKIINHRDYFDFCGPTFGPVPILGSFIRWLYSRFVT